MDQALRYFGGPRQLGASVGDLIIRNPVPVTLIGVGFAWLAFAGARNTRFEHDDPRWAERLPAGPCPRSRGAS